MSKLTKESLICIKKTFKKFLSILLIVLLGVGFFAGIKATSPDMKNTLDKYFKDTNFYDLFITSNYGVTSNIIDTLKNNGYYAEGSYSFDTIIKNKEEYAVKVISYDKDSKLNKLVLKSGRLPKDNSECVIEKSDMTKKYKIGDILEVENDSLNNKKLKIVGFVESPLYISRERDSTKLLSGKINYNIYTPISNFNSCLYTNLYVDLDIDENIFSDKYFDKIDKEKENIKKLSSSFINLKYKEIIDNANNQINDAKNLYNKNKSELEPLLNSPYVPLEQKNEIRTNLDNAFKEIKENEEKINNIDKVEWYILDIKSNVGYYMYSKDTERITNIAKIFPLVFFVVAILICLTTMTRMVEEERVQIGTLKSLGYSSLKISFKYILYALLATLFGSVFGVIIGFSIIPRIIFNMYTMMYSLGNFNSSFYLGLTLQGTIIALVCTIGSTIFTLYKTLKEEPAQLLLPKAPKAGKRVLLERIPFIWKRLSFSKKVTVRNVFRYKKRFLMTIIGISGCTGLILAGFGLKDCIVNMVPNQYEDIFKYKIEITLKDDVSLDTKNKDLEYIKSQSEVKDLLQLHKETVKIKDKDTNEQITLVVPFSDISKFISLKDRKTDKEYKLKDGVIITEKISKLLELNKNDTIKFKGDKLYNKKIDNITENYLYHYIYMSKDNYNSDQYNTLLIKTDQMNSKEEKEFAKKINELESVSSINYTSVVKNAFDETMKNFSYVSLVLIVSAGLLALVVLYNLSSVNISERRRELATIKVLGFYDKEVYNYVARETTILTVIGMILGLIIGKILTGFIIKTCEVDMLMFDPAINFMSYIYSLLITSVFTMIVSIIVYFSLKKIDMISSLKSVE